MNENQILILGIILATVIMFLWGRWRHDMVALCSLLLCVFTGLIPSNEAFLGFGHPAVITVACVLILSRGVQSSGAIDVLSRTILPSETGVVLSMTALVGLAALLSGFMNNVGAMALLMPVAMQLAKRLNLTPGQVLMPLAFGTILGGMTTLIGTPSNLIVSSFRASNHSDVFAMFDFAPVGIVVAVSGIIFITFIGWRWVPIRKQSGIEGFESGAYITEVRVGEASKVVGMRLREFERELDNSGAQSLGMIHNGVRLIAPQYWRKIYAGDVIIIEAEAESLSEILSSLNLVIESEARIADKKEAVETQNELDASLDLIDSDKDSAQDSQQVSQENSTEDADIILMELAVLPGASVSGRSASDISMRSRYGINLLALSRQGSRSFNSLRKTDFRSGDLLLMQGAQEAILQFAADNGCVPLAERDIRIPDRKKIITASIIMALAVGLAAFGILPVVVAFAAGALASMVFKTVPIQSVYNSIEWPVIVLLGALIPVAGAMEKTGAADLLANAMLNNLAAGNGVFALVLILVVTMFLSDLVNNAATAGVMCPIALSTANSLGVSADSFLMAVAIGASCAFLTPIGHQNNTLILGPGGFKFSDYWRLGLPLEILVVIISVPMLLLVWPL